MDANEVVLPGGVDRWQAEQALDTLMRAANIQADPKMMNAVSEFAAVKKEELDRFSPDTPIKKHKDATRKGRVDF